MWVHICVSFWGCLLEATVMADFTRVREHYEELYETYWQKYRELDELERIMKKARTDMEAVCQHDWVQDWEDRDNRSRWKCRHCNKGR